jgi:hypothetical protein
MAHEDAKITYADLGPRDADGFCFCSKLDSKVHIDQRTWDVWEARCFGGYADIRREHAGGPAQNWDWQVMLLHR